MMGGQTESNLRSPMTRMDENTKRKEWLKLEKLVESKTSHLALFEALQVVQSNNG